MSSNSFKAAILRLVVAAHIRDALGYQFIRQDTLPSENLSDKCVGALTTDLTSCPQQVSAFFTGDWFESDSLEEACTSACAVDLSQYVVKAGSACGPEDTYEISSVNKAPVSFIPTLLQYHFNKTCIQDEGRWCHVVAHEMSIGMAESTPMMRTNMSTIVSKCQVCSPDISASKTNDVGRQSSPDMCDNCVIKAYQFQAGSPINGGYALQSNYSSLTESCSKTSFPLESSTTLFPEPTITDTPAECTGSTYSLKSGDTCQSVSRSQGVSTAWLLADNGLSAFCIDFPQSGDLCIQNKCETYTVRANDTCVSIAKAHSISQVQLYTWNPVLDTLCRSIDKSVGDSICVTPPGDDEYNPAPAPTTSTPAPSATAAPVPDDIAQGTTKNCSNYYQVQPDEYCNLLIVKFSISLEDFLFLNQGVNANCTNLFAFESYCVAPLGPINQYPGHPDYIPPGSTISDMPYSNLPKATFTAPAITGLPTAAPLAKGTRTDCFIYINGEDLTVDMYYWPNHSACEVLAGGWGIKLEQLANWNPSLMTNSSDCAPDVNFRYCMAAYDSATITAIPLPQETEESGYPIREGATKDCVEYEAIVAPMTCETFLKRNHITIAQFYKWNPAVGEDCRNLWLDYRYCVSIDEQLRILDSKSGTCPRRM
ncbi:hypothetical protein F5B22DRAFT_633991 [Xylaria bambusicola]|uniref:uncharacterized protein n=1 Tax=Xylaria bambusicola TaxID=326684 RepID=UPI00200722CF|nr:uncharacterized protein F5B22DRAFT_633991 [Xylaria bambusicola]KAI0523940.1 hypothetical protein F5B22DRAFT_633991 [Xylaria bambusicola]